jgi:hypothetical protein
MKQLEFFKEFTGVKFKEAICKIDDQYYENWEIIRSERNDFTHKNPFSIDNVDLINKALYIIKNSTKIFAYIYNTYVYKNNLGKAEDTTLI